MTLPSSFAPKPQRDREKKSLRIRQEEERKAMMAKELAKKIVKKEQEARMKIGQGESRDSRREKERIDDLARTIYNRMKEAERAAQAEREVAKHSGKSKHKVGVQRALEDFSQAIADKFKSAWSPRPKEERS